MTPILAVLRIVLKLQFVTSRFTIMFKIKFDLEYVFFLFGDDLAILLARVFLGVTWRCGALEQVVFLPAIQQHQQEG